VYEEVGYVRDVGCHRLSPINVRLF
jgi:hypothetical protein